MQKIKNSASIDDFGEFPETDIASNRSTKRPTAAIDSAEVSIKEEEISKESIISQYTHVGNGITVCGSTFKKLKPGVYDISRLDNGLPFFTKKKIVSDSWINFHESDIVEILGEIKKFWEKKEVFKKYGILQRRGYMFYGPPGSGKTILVKQICHKLIKDGGIVFMAHCHPSLLSNAITLFRQIEPERKVIAVFEDIDSIVASYGEPALLSYLDGEDSNDYIINLATTNYPETLDKRIISRPRRFDRLLKIGYPDNNMRRAYFNTKLGLEGAELENWVNLTNELPFGALTEALISVKCLDISIEDAVARIRSLVKTQPSSADFDETKPRAMGFGK